MNTVQLKQNTMPHAGIRLGMLALALFASQSFATPSTAQENDFTSRQSQINSLKTSINLNSEANKIYGLGKAQCWVNFAKHEWTRNDHSQAVPESLQEADKLLEQLKLSAKIGHETKLVDGSQKIRPDLWSAADSLKTKPGFRCAAAATACGEVLLVQAAHNQAQLGWRYANPYVGMAEDMLQFAKEEEARCVQAQPMIAALPTPATASAVAPVVKPPEPPKPVVIPQAEKITLQASALFKFDRFNDADLLPEGKAQIEDAVKKLKSYKQVLSIKLTGHTDRLGTDAYNYPLSLNRAVTVKKHMENLGVDGNKITVLGVGSSVPVTRNCDVKHDKKLANPKKLQACLQPDRRVVIDFIAEK